MNVLMPQLGETVSEGKISVWFKSVGDAVKPGENLFEIETDKVSMEVPATSAGVLAEIRVSAGDVAPVGAVVAVIAGAGETATSPAASTRPQPSASAPIAAPRPVAPIVLKPAVPLDPFREVRTPERNYGPARLPGGTAVTPLARRLATEFGVELARIVGSGPHGRIVARDIETVAARSATGPIAAPASGPSAVQILSLYRDVPHEDVPLDNMRRTIASRMVQAKQTIPHFYLTADITVDRLLNLREEANAAAPKNAAGEPAFKLSINDFVIKAMALALQRVPAANAVWAEDRILRFKHSDIGVAVAIDGGLVTPVIRKAEAKTPTAISAEMKELSTRARTKRLQPQEYQGGATTVSNLGMFGVREFSAIINPPHATLLAVGCARRQPIESADGGIAFVSMMTVTLSCDHRVVDGVLGAELIAALKGFLEKPVTMLV
jgi:pyruvate dehydrogenase E2 component (dihydrolipoamide acetyltransferase)